MPTLKVKRLSSHATIPTYAHPGEDACFDLKVIVDDNDNTPFIFSGGEKFPLPNNHRIEDADGGLIGSFLHPGESIVFHTGLACELPPGYVMKIYARSSTGIKKHIMLSNGVGIIDSGYRGEIHLSLTNFGDEPVCLRDGDRIAQAEVCPIENVIIEETIELTDTSRGTGGIGSSGTN